MCLGPDKGHRLLISSNVCQRRFCHGPPTLHFERRAVTVGLSVSYWRLAMAFWGDAVIAIEAGQKGQRTNGLLQLLEEALCSGDRLH